MRDYLNEYPKANFYKLDTTKPYSVLGNKKNGNVFLVIAVILIILTVFLFIFNYNDLFQTTTTTIVPIVMIVAAVIFLVIAIYRIRRSKSARNKILEHSTLTDGVITDVRIIRYVHRTRYYIATVSYSFIDADMNERVCSLETTFDYKDEMYVGQNVMVAFTHSKSFIMEKFTLLRDDEQRFRYNEAARSDNDFDGLSGRLVYIDKTKPVTSLEHNKALVVLAVILACILPAYLLFIAILIIPQMRDTGFDTVTIIVCSAFALAAAILIISVICLLFKYFKRQKRVNKILEANPYFTWGRVFYSENTYGNKSRKQVMYCYIDKWYEKHTEVLKVSLTASLVHPCETVIAYTADGKSVPLDKYTLTEY